MFFSLVIILIIGVFIWIRVNKRYPIFYLYSGPYSGILPYKTTVKDPPLIFCGPFGETRNINNEGGVKNPKYIMFVVRGGELDNEIILVDLFEKYPPEKGEYIVVRQERTGNYYLRKIENPYSGYDNEEDYKYDLGNGEIIGYPEIVGNVKYRKLR
jgi:hypothetical protein